MGRLFGTDGVRGVANADLSCELAFDLGQAGAHALIELAHKKDDPRPPRMLVGRDTRLSGEMLEAALVSGICSTGARAILVGVIPSPAVAYLTRLYGCDAGVVISASHNPMEDNGIKFFTNEGYKLPDELEDRIEAIMGEKRDFPLPTAAGVGRVTHESTAKEKYIDFLLSTAQQPLGGMMVVMDCANGAAFDVAPKVFAQLGAQVLPFYAAPTGGNINELCGSTHPERLQEIVKVMRADVGFAFDGDADRLIAVDETGAVVDGDRIMWVCGNHMRDTGTLAHDTLVGTVMTNMGLELALEARGIHFERTAVGDRHVLERMRENGYTLGGEQSGHIVFHNLTTTGDGILSAIQLINVMKATGKPLSELASGFEDWPQALIGVRVDSARKYAFETDAEVQAAIAAATARLEGRGRILVRASGTEPKVRVMVEGENRARIETEAAALVSLLERKYRPQSHDAH